MASVIALREGVADRLRTIGGLDVRTKATGNALVPAAIVQTALGGPVITYNVDLDSSVDVNLVVTLLVNTVITDAAEERLERFVATDGPESVKAALDGDPTLGGIAHYAIITEVRQYGLVNYSGSDYLGCELAIVARAQ